MIGTFSIDIVVGSYEEAPHSWAPQAAAQASDAEQAAAVSPCFVSPASQTAIFRRNSSAFETTMRGQIRIQTNGEKL